jgi:hypothetical protein
MLGKSVLRMVAGFLFGLCLGALSVVQVAPSRSSFWFVYFFKKRKKG